VTKQAPLPVGGSARRLGRKPSRGLLLAILMVLALVLLGFGISGLLSVEHSMTLLKPVPGGRQTTGTIVSSSESCDRGCDYQPTIEYRDLSGQAYRFTAPDQNQKPAVGSKVKVSYDPRLPADAHDISVSPSTWDSPRDAMIFAIASGGAGVVGVGGLLGVRLALRRARERAQRAITDFR
jgi:hypothetical protein